MITQNLRQTRASLLIERRVNIVEDVYRDVIGAVAKEFGFPVAKMTCKRRNFELVMARNMACYILHTTFKQKASQIAPYFFRDRTTILHAVNSFPKDLEQIPFLMEKYEYVMNLISHMHSKIYALK
jgi:chromosomal replication initiation ATPase DnaA